MHRNCGTIQIKTYKLHIKASTMFKLKFGKTTNSENQQSSSENKDEVRERVFLRPGTIEEEPDSVDSIISNPASFPITIIPSNNMPRSATQISMNRYSRQSSSR